MLDGNPRIKRPEGRFEAKNPNLNSSLNDFPLRFGSYFALRFFLGFSHSLAHAISVMIPLPLNNEHMGISIDEELRVGTTERTRYTLLHDHDS